MEIGKSIRFILQQRQWPGGCVPPRSRPGVHPEGPSAAGYSLPITPASLAEGASPSPEVYAAPGNVHVLSSVHAHAAGWCGRGFGAGRLGSHRPQAHCRCRHMHVRAAIGPHRRPARPPAHTGTSVSREALKFIICLLMSWDLIGVNEGLN